MIGPKLLITTVILASGVLTACSDMTGPAEPEIEKFAGGALFAQGSRPCVAPGGGYPGALNMLHDPTMASIPMQRDAPQGNAGMERAVAQSAC
jgi:hypothetical protein